MNVLTVDHAIAILLRAKEQVGGNAALVLSLTDSAIGDVNVNDMVVQDGYVEVCALHPELTENDQWLIYFDAHRKLFDAVEASDSEEYKDWQTATYKEAKKFVAEMCERDGWSRGH